MPLSLLRELKLSLWQLARNVFEILRKSLLNHVLFFSSGYVPQLVCLPWDGKTQNQGNGQCKWAFCKQWCSTFLKNPFSRWFPEKWYIHFVSFHGWNWWKERCYQWPHVWCSPPQWNDTTIIVHRSTNGCTIERFKLYNHSAGYSEWRHCVSGRVCRGEITQLTILGTGVRKLVLVPERGCCPSTCWKCRGRGCSFAVSSHVRLALIVVDMK